MKKIAKLISLTLACVCLAGCGKEAAPQTASTSTPTYKWDFVKKNDGINQDDLLFEK